MLNLYNSLTKDVEAFVPNTTGLVKMYVCGPTVYDHGHLGHARSSVSFDLLRRTLEYLGYTVYFVSNYTDIDDKMIARAKERGIAIEQLSKEIIQSYEEDMKKLNVREPTVRPYATHHISDMIDLVKDLEAKEYAYATSSGVYFRVSKFADYGKLSNFKIEDAVSQDSDITDKENPKDFALMKLSKEGEPSWNMPWGKMRPGWHIECSAMSMKYLGSPFDIHGGGIDLLFPHHENELAQSECATGKKFANYWVHNGFLTMDKEKMSKSLGNFFIIKEILDKGYSGDDIRYFLLTSHYRKPLEYDIKALDDAKSRVQYISETRSALIQAIEKNGEVEENLYDFLTKAFQIEQEFKAALANDLNTPDALAALNSLLKLINNIVREHDGYKGSIAADLLYRLDRMLGVLGLLEKDMSASASTLDTKLIELLIEIRDSARKQKDWNTSDMIRDNLKELGVHLEDLKGKTIWKLT